MCVCVRAFENVGEERESERERKAEDGWILHENEIQAAVFLCVMRSKRVR